MQSSSVLFTPKLIAACACIYWSTATFAQQNQCSITSGATITPVVELYTSEGCSSCPPADKWASTLKGISASGGAVVQAFHVGYWDYIGWVDRFAAPAYTQRQRDIAAKNNLRSIYTPQAVLDGKDWPRWGGKPESKEPAKANIALKQLGADQFEASVTPVALASSWSAYWTVTEHGHNSKVLSGENKGEYLKHDFVVRQLVQAGQYKAGDTAAQKLSFRSIAPTPGHPRQVNLVVFDDKTGKTLQAVSLQCAS
jgi:hypothetical protein